MSTHMITDPADHKATFAECIKHVAVLSQIVGKASRLAHDDHDAIAAHKGDIVSLLATIQAVVMPSTEPSTEPESIPPTKARKG